MKTPVTIWKRYEKNANAYIHNHIEEGWCEDNYPTPKDDAQAKSWLSNNVKWRRVYGYLENGKVVERDEE